MALFRKKLIFQADDALPDPEELKFRFSRRILFTTLLGALCLLGFPVLRDLRPYFAAKTQARRFAQIILDCRLLATRERKSVALEMDPSDAHRWIRSLRKTADHCETPSSAGEEVIAPEGVRWELRYKAEESAEVRSASHLCFHPIEGLFAEGASLQQGHLLVAAFSEADELNRSAKILLTDGNAEINFLSE